MNSWSSFGHHWSGDGIAAYFSRNRKAAVKCKHQGFVQELSSHPSENYFSGEEENVLQEISMVQKLYLITRYFNGLVRMVSVIKNGKTFANFPSTMTFIRFLFSSHRKTSLKTGF